jgi:hypothetical protein
LYRVFEFRAPLAEKRRNTHYKKGGKYVRASFFGELALGADARRFEGRRRKIKLKATYTWQMINGVGRYFFFLIFEIFLWRFLCVSQQGEFKNTIKNFLGKNTCQKLLAEKVES